MARTARVGGIGSARLVFGRGFLQVIDDDHLGGELARVEFEAELLDRGDEGLLHGVLRRRRLPSGGIGAKLRHSVFEREVQRELEEALGLRHVDDLLLDDGSQQCG